MSPETPSKSITLYFREGSSDKVYQAGIEAEGAGFVVNFAFGRRGSTLQTGTKTAQPVDYQAALKVYDKLLRAKMAKGYTPGQSGTPYQGTDRQSLAMGVFPQRSSTPSTRTRRSNWSSTMTGGCRRSLTASES